MALTSFTDSSSVKGGKIMEIVVADNGDANLLLDTGDSLSVSDEWMARFSPQVGGYYIQDASGYDTYSPSSAIVGTSYVAPFALPSFATAAQKDLFILKESQAIQQDPVRMKAAKAIAGSANIG